MDFNHGLPYYKIMWASVMTKDPPTASVIVYVSLSRHVFSITWQAMIKTHNTEQKLIVCIDVATNAIQSAI